jgi:hypothetical protein
VPVTFLSFEGEKQNDDVMLVWKTASEKNNNFFNLEVSSDGKSFTSIGKVRGAGNSNQVKTYNFKHEQAFLTHANGGGSLYYRLAQHDFDGTVNFTSIIHVRQDLKSSNYVQVFPNPNTGIFSMVSDPSIKLQGGLKLYNRMGELVWQMNESAVTDKIDMNLDLADGMYILQTMVNDTKVYVKILVAH